MNAKTPSIQLENLNRAQGTALDETKKALVATQEALVSSQKLSASLQEGVTILQMNVTVLEETRDQILRGGGLSEDINRILREQITKLENLVRLAREVAEQSEENVRLEFKMKAEQGK